LEFQPGNQFGGEGMPGAGEGVISMGSREIDFEISWGARGKAGWGGVAAGERAAIEFMIDLQRVLYF
jgi:hypothetical protein